jgi:hypothetical protein
MQDKGQGSYGKKDGYIIKAEEGKKSKVLTITNNSLAESWDNLLNSLKGGKVLAVTFVNLTLGQELVGELSTAVSQSYTATNGTYYGLNVNIATTGDNITQAQTDFYQALQPYTFDNNQNNDAGFLYPRVVVDFEYTNNHIRYTDRTRDVEKKEDVEEEGLQVGENCCSCQELDMRFQEDVCEFNYPNTLPPGGLGGNGSNY